MNWFMQRLGEKSTWLGIFTLIGLLGIKVEPEFRELIIDAILAVAAIVAFIFREKEYVKKSDLQLIKLVGASESSAKCGIGSAVDSFGPAVWDNRDADSAAQRLQSELPTERNNESGWNG